MSTTAEDSTDLGSSSAGMTELSGLTVASRLPPATDRVRSLWTKEEDDDGPEPELSLDQTRWATWKLYDPQAAGSAQRIAAQAARRRDLRIGRKM